MAHGSAPRACGVVTALCGLLLSGCTGGSGHATGTATPKATASSNTGTARTGSPRSRALVSRTDPAKVPRTPAQARALLEKVVAGPELFGPHVVRATPFERDPDRWVYLGDDCAWRQEALPKDVLATATWRYEEPAADGKGSVRLQISVGVHRTALDAAWAQARMLEEGLGCGEQLLRPGERLTGLNSSGILLGERGNDAYDDWLIEDGECVSDTRGGPYPYAWYQATLGPVVIGVSGCGGRGRTDDDVHDPVSSVQSKMAIRVQQAIGWEAVPATGSASSSASASVSPSVKEGS
ncbi:hypothetical protein ACQEWB_35495 [Streptomyces sp. CA-249302]|uniref:hypothetical protein n=1 Tax=Streptomyces sp. CA-249302 TaxID=3240058 RepID=UPI003D8D687C